MVIAKESQCSASSCILAETGLRHPGGSSSRHHFLPSTSMTLLSLIRSWLSCCKIEKQTVPKKHGKGSEPTRIFCSSGQKTLVASLCSPQACSDSHVNFVVKKTRSSTGGAHLLPLSQSQCCRSPEVTWSHYSAWHHNDASIRLPSIIIHLRI